MDKVGTSITRERGLLQLSMRAVERRVDDVSSRKDWWEVCENVQTSIGSNMMKHRRKLTPFSPLNFLGILYSGISRRQDLNLRPSGFC
ncbi:hypothetical protein HRbin02_01284 [Candidatus Calditenuaceae archaeon HR02]|nr:hypothetical protein HRbin02_01284 [Candidatus Calditenuaceae archaeon HR02]